MGVLLPTDGCGDAGRGGITTDGKPTFALTAFVGCATDLATTLALAFPLGAAFVAAGADFEPLDGEGDEAPDKLAPNKPEGLSNRCGSTSASVPRHAALENVNPGGGKEANESGCSSEDSRGDGRFPGWHDAWTDPSAEMFKDIGSAEPNGSGPSGTRIGIAAAGIRAELPLLEPGDFFGFGAVAIGVVCDTDPANCICNAATAESKASPSSQAFSAMGLAHGKGGADM